MQQKAEPEPENPGKTHQEMCRRQAARRRPDQHAAHDGRRRWGVITATSGELGEDVQHEIFSPVMGAILDEVVGLNVIGPLGAKALYRRELIAWDPRGERAELR